MFLSGFITYMGLNRLASVAYIYKGDYSQIVYTILGKYFKIIIDITLFITQFSFAIPTIIYMIHSF